MDNKCKNQVAGTNRRGLLIKGLAVLGAFFLGRKASANVASSASGLVTEGEVLKTSVYKGRPPMEPLDTMIRFERSDDNNGRAMTHEILSLMHEEKGRKSYPWTVYSHLTTHHEEGDACVLCSRLTKNGPGWSSGLHSEVFNNDRGVGLGVNIEMSNTFDPTKTQLIGLNIQSLGPKPCQYGIQIHGDRGSFQKGIGLNNARGEVGLDIGGNYETGINTHHNSIRVNEGACIELDGVGKIRFRYKEGRIEFLNGDKVVCHIRMDGEDHEL